MSCPRCGEAAAAGSEVCASCNALLAARVDLSPATGALRLPRLPLGSQPLVLGRAEGSDVLLPFPQVSAQHARLTHRADGTCLIEDLGSAGGTYVDGVRVRKAVVRPGSRFTLGTVSVHLDAADCVCTEPLRGTVRIEVDGLSRVVPHRGSRRPLALLQDVSLTVFPSELVGIMGPSGSGKTTLLLALAGYEKPSGGRVLLNGEDLVVHYDRFRRVLGYVPQDDIMHKELTVAESLYYAARLRLPPDTTDGEIRGRIERVLGELHLGEQRDEIIGSVEEKVLSGGQRRRVNMAQELIGDPEVLLLDEPTSGLSAGEAADVMDVLRSLANCGRTVVLTIHQPSSRLYAQMDHLCVLAPGGRLAFFGPAAPDAYEFFGASRQTPDELMECLDERTPEAWAEKYRSSPQHETYVVRRAEGAAGSAERAVGAPRRVEAPATIGPRPLRQFGTLLRRYATVKLRDRRNLAMLVLQAPVIGTLLGFVFRSGGEPSMPIFCLVITVMFFGCFNASREIVAERALHRRERMISLRNVPYVFAKFCVLGLVDLVQAAILLAVVVPLLGLQGSWLASFAVLALTGLAATALGLLLSSVMKSPEAAMALVPMLLVPEVVLSGQLTDLDRPWLDVTSATMFSRWSLEALLDVEEIARPEMTRLAAGDAAAQCPAGDRPMIGAAPPAASGRPPTMHPRQHGPATHHRVLRDSAIILGLLLAALGATLLALRRRAAGPS